jgi:hypothetical protein
MKKKQNPLILVAILVAALAAIAGGMYYLSEAPADKNPQMGPNMGGGKMPSPDKALTEGKTSDTDKAPAEDKDKPKEDAKPK